MIFHDKTAKSPVLRAFSCNSSLPQGMDKPIKKRAGSSIVIFDRKRRPCLALRAAFIVSAFQNIAPCLISRFFSCAWAAVCGFVLVKICPPPAAFAVISVRAPIRRFAAAVPVKAYSYVPPPPAAASPCIRVPILHKQQQASLS